MILGIISRKIFCPFKSWILTKRYVDKGNGRFFIMNPFLKIRIIKQKGAIFELNGIFQINPYMGGTAPVNIILSSNSQFTINGNFDIGHGLTFFVASRAKLIIENGGVTSECKILVKKLIEIGKNFTCAWGCTITDCDWHTIEGTEICKPIHIGNNVWIGNNSCVLKGSSIGNHSVVASCSKLINKTYPDNVLIVGTQGEIAKENIQWHR